MSLASNTRSSGLRIAVLGYIVRCPLGGLTWHYLHYVLGLARLGHEVFFIEDSDDYPGCYDPTRHVVDTDPTYGLEYTRRTFERVGLGDRWAYHDAHAGRWRGPGADDVLAFCAGADLLLNLSCMNPLRPWLEDVPVRVLVDTDPVFTQIRHHDNPAARALAERHNVFLTFGENFGRPNASIPDDGLPWQPTRQPIVLDAWPPAPGAPDGAFTTVMQWESYGARLFGGHRYGLKSDSFKPYSNLPFVTGARLEMALGTPSAPRDELRGRGWRLRDPLAVTRDPWTYQGYIQQSKAEFTVAKEGYVSSRSGWFSERSAAYLASGRPVVVQDTGFGEWMESGAGVLPFRTPEEAMAGLEDVSRRYDMHCRAARRLAETHFDSHRVLSDLIETAMGGVV